MRRATRAVATLACLTATAGVALLSAGAGISSADAGCPNEALRQESNPNPFTLQPFSTQLPECRAYEMVSPPFKSGSPIQVAPALSRDGSRVIVGASGAFAGTGSDVFGAKYELRRTASGWTAASINPPASVFPAIDPKFFLASVDLEKTLWALRSASQSTNARDLYIRDSNGTFVEIGPTAPPSATGGPPAGSSQEFGEFFSFAGASNDLSHVLFNAVGVGGSSQPWPGDTTIDHGASLYGYVGTGNSRPELVGVSDGSTVVEGKAVPRGDLISDCSTYLGAASSEDVYNAISATGETVFFTSKGRSAGQSCAEATGNRAPAVNELYARIGDLETVAISEPREAACGECQTTTPAGANFQGASVDGSKVFFLTEQELLPGAEGPNLYEYDFTNRAGKKVLRVSTGSPKPEVLGVSRVSEDGSHAYFVADGALTTGPNREGEEPTVGKPNLYVFRRDATFPAGNLAFVATLSEEDSSDWSVSDERPVQATPDGRYLVFTSVADLTAGDTSTEPQIFEYDAQNEELVRVSTGQVGYPEGEASADQHTSKITAPEYGLIGGFRPARAASELAVSDDGSTVLFHSVGALTPLAVEASAAGAESVYLYRSSGALSNGNTYLISDGRNKLTPQGDPIGLTPDAANAIFLTVDPVLGQDTDVQYDLYDARINGGFPASTTPAICAGGACRGTPTPAPSGGPPAATPNFVGPPNPAASPKKPKKPRRHKKHKKKHQKRANTDRGGPK